MLLKLIFSLALMSGQQAGDSIYVSVMFGTSASLVMHVMYYPLQLSLSVHVLFVRVVLFQLTLCLVYYPTNSRMDTTVFFHPFQYKTGL